MHSLHGLFEILKYTYITVLKFLLRDIGHRQIAEIVENENVNKSQEMTEGYKTNNNKYCYIPPSSFDV